MMTGRCNEEMGRNCKDLIKNEKIFLATKVSSNKRSALIKGSLLWSVFYKLSRVRHIHKLFAISMQSLKKALAISM
jgi:hypothetical protein